jgi:Neuraminidase (sialidase)
MPRQLPHRLVRLLMVVAIVSVLSSSTALASAYTATAPIAISGLSPFAGCTDIGGVGDPPGVNYPNSEVEPFIAVNPTNPRNMIGVFQQDRWSNGGARGLVAAVTHDGGVTWHETWAPFSRCSGGTAANGGDYERASDPWVSFGPDGVAYQISLSVSSDETTSAILTSTSHDGGETWSNPATLIRDTNPVFFNDKESITADPTRAGYAYAVWDRGTLPDNGHRSAAGEAHSFAYRGQPLISRTTDGGQTWSTPAPLTNQNMFTIGNQIVVVPDGTLVDVTAMYRGSGRQPSANQAFEGVMLSHDAGVTWSQPIKIANQRGTDPTDPETGDVVRAGVDIPDIAVAPNGTLYVVWGDAGPSGGTHTDIVLSRSTDGGRTWSTPVKVNQTPTTIPAGNQQAFTATVHVAADGTVGVGYYDFRSNTTDPATLWTDYWFAHSHDGGQTWSETHVAGPFDMRSAPYARGFFLGDYAGLTSVGTQFIACFAVANTGNVLNPTDVVVSRIGP